MVFCLAANFTDNFVRNGLLDHQSVQIKCLNLIG